MYWFKVRAVILSLPLIACTSVQGNAKDWLHLDGSSVDALLFNQAYAQCEYGFATRQYTQSPSSDNWQVLSSASACMENEGYQLIKKNLVKL